MGSVQAVLESCRNTSFLNWRHSTYVKIRPKKGNNNIKDEGMQVLSTGQNIPLLKELKIGNISLSYLGRN